MIATTSPATTRTLNQITHSETIDSNWRSLYRLAGIAAVIVLSLALLDISVSMLLPTGDQAPDARSAVEWFTLLQTNVWYGLRDLGILNIFNSILNVPVYLALYALHRRTNQAYALLALILFLLGGTIYIANNTVLPLLALSSKYAAASTELQRTVLLAAGEAMLVRGADFTLGSILGMVLPLIGSLIMALVLLRGGVFGKVAAYADILSAVCLLIFTGLTIFFPASFAVAMLIAMPGGILAVAWNVLAARRLFQLARMV